MSANTHTNAVEFFGYRIEGNDRQASLIEMIEKIFSDTAACWQRHGTENWISEFFKEHPHPDENPIFWVAAVGFSPVEFAEFNAEHIADIWINGGFFDPETVGEESAASNRATFYTDEFDDVNSGVLEEVTEALVSLAYEIEDFINKEIDERE